MQVEKKHKQVWWDGCRKCECIDSTIICLDRQCPAQCTGKDGKVHNEEEQWVQECNVCYCDMKKGAVCSKKECGCAVEKGGEIIAQHGEVVQVEGSGSCFCLSGNLRCTNFF